MSIGLMSISHWTISAHDIYQDVVVGAASVVSGCKPHSTLTSSRLEGREPHPMDPRLELGRETAGVHFSLAYSVFCGEEWRSLFFLRVLDSTWERLLMERAKLLLGHCCLRAWIAFEIIGTTLTQKEDDKASFPSY